MASRGPSLLIVVDTSVVMSWLLQDESDFEAHLPLLRARTGIAPALLPFEVGNAIQMAVRRRRVSGEDGVEALRLFYELEIAIEAAPAVDVSQRILRLCEAHHITAYDAAYLELAQRRVAPLASNDRALCSVAAEIGIRVL